MSKFDLNISARDSILRSIRDHLAASAPYDAIHEESKGLSAASFTLAVSPNRDRRSLSEDNSAPTYGRNSLMQTFKENLEAVGGHCILVEDDAAAPQAVSKIISDLQKSALRARRIALSNSSVVETVFRRVQIDVDEITTNPSQAEIFNYDVGISASQYAVAETGTLVLESDVEKHRLVSLVPPVHIAIIEADKIYFTIAEALTKVNQGNELSPAVTLITGPSRTADIELTLAIGVHGPQELYVIVIGNPIVASENVTAETRRTQS